MAAIQFQDIHGVVNDGSGGIEFQHEGGTYGEQAAGGAPAAGHVGWMSLTGVGISLLLALLVG